MASNFIPGGGLATVGIKTAVKTTVKTVVKKEADEVAQVVVKVSKSKYPETAKHIEDAQSAGHPGTLTINRPGAAANRKDSLAGVSKVRGKDLDEYPPAMFKEGGKGASVRSISPKDNRGAGASMGNQLRNQPNGTKVKITIVK